MDLTTDGLWAMPLNTGWVPVKARRLQDWEKLKKYVPIHKQGDVCPDEVPALVERDNNGMIRIQNNQWAPVHCSVTRNFWLCAQKCEHLTPPPPPNPYFSETAFLRRFQKVYTYPPKRNNILAHWAKSAEKPGKMPKPTVLAHSE